MSGAFGWRSSSRPLLIWCTPIDAQLPSVRRFDTLPSFGLLPTIMIPARFAGYAIRLTSIRRGFGASSSHSSTLLRFLIARGGIAKRADRLDKRLPQLPQD